MSGGGEKDKKGKKQKKEPQGEEKGSETAKSESREILRELYTKELVSRYSKTNGYDKVFLVEQVAKLFQEYKITKENMGKIEKKMEKQFDANYMQKFAMKQGQILAEKSQKKVAAVGLGKKAAGGTTVAKQSEKEKSSQSKEASVRPSTTPSNIKTSVEEKSSILDKVSLADSTPCDMQKLWDKENLKLNAIKLKEQAARKKELDEQQNSKEAEARREKEEKEKYLREQKVLNKKQDEIDKQKAAKLKQLNDENMRLTKQQKADKEKAALSELRFELKKHDEMMEIVEKGNQASEIAKKLKARESRQLLRTQMREVKRFTKQQLRERSLEKEEEKERMRTNDEIEQARERRRKNEVQSREEHVKKIMDAYHQKIGLSLEERAMQDEKEMIEVMKIEELKEQRVIQQERAKTAAARLVLREKLNIQLEEKKQKDEDERRYDQEGDRLQLYKLKTEQEKRNKQVNCDKQLLNLNNTKEKKVLVAAGFGRILAKGESAKEKMSKQELLLNKSILKRVATTANTIELPGIPKLRTMYIQ